MRGCGQRFDRRLPLRLCLACERGVVELVGLLGYYTLVSMTLNTFEVELPDGEVSDLVP